MMPQMNPSDARQEQQNPDYGKYEGASSYGQQQYRPSYETPPAQGSPYDDHYSDPLGTHMHAGQGPMGKIYTRSQTPPPVGMRLALAIVSLCLLIPLAAIIFGILHASGIAPFIAVCIAFVIINGVFNSPGKS